MTDPIAKARLFSKGVLQHTPVLVYVFNARADETQCPCATFVQEMKEVNSLCFLSGAGSA